ncbi:MAG: 5'-nucleotidase C-terminal domain-containing protein [Nocardioidaceae bacterium]|nr:5'-nucleotidase C-terminal domain-containing protein [Nocardioidaceae bacterium]
MLTPRRAIAASAVSLALLALTAPAQSSPAPDVSDQGRGGESARQAYKRLSQTSGAQAGKVRLDLLAINDFHGNLETIPATSSSGRINNTPAGGVEYLARHLKKLRVKSRANDATPVTVAAGDLIGASPLLSAAFHDEPSIEALNAIGLQVASVGNHEFDEGWRELRRMQRGGCIADGPDGQDNQNSCPDHRFAGADFRYLSANVKWDDDKTHKRPTLLPAYKVLNVEGIKVGFIGMTLKDTPSIVTQSGIQGLRFTDEVRTANRLVPELRERGAEAIVVLLHQGVVPTDSTAYNDCSGVTGPALDIAQNLRPAIDAVVSGHTHQPYNCTVRDPKGQPRLLTSASSYGRVVTNVHLLLDPETRDVVRPAAYAVNKIVTNNQDGPDADTLPDANVKPVAALSRLIALYKELVAPIANEVIGHLDGVALLSKTQDDSGESPLGNLIADAQKADPSVIPPGGEAPTIAFMNPGGIRADLIENANGDVTYEAAFTTQPFNNYLVSMDLTGQQILDLLEQQWSGDNASFNKILQVSGIEYTWDQSEPPGSKVVTGSVMVDSNGDGTADAPLNPALTYRIVCNSFLSDGGDSFSVFASGTDKYIGGLDIDALVNYLNVNDPYTPVATDRIDVQP